MKRSELSMDIAGNNALKANAIKLLQLLLPILTGCIGMKIFNVKGETTKKFEAVNMPVVEPEQETTHKSFSGFTWYLTEKYSQLQLNLRFRLNGGSHDDKTAYCGYYEKNIELGEMQSGTLISIKTLENITKHYNLNPDPTESTILQLIEAYKNSQRDADHFKSLVPPNYRKFI